MDYEVTKNASKTYIFRKKIAAGAAGILSTNLVAHGYVTGVSIRFSSGESGTLQLRPVVTIPGEITIDLLEYADNGDPYITGDDENVKSAVRIEIENRTALKVYYNNTGACESFVNVDVEVTYFQFVEPANVIGAAKQEKRKWF